MIIKEFRIPMPLSLPEFQVGHLYTTMETAKLETGGGDGVEELVNEPFADHELGCFGVVSGQYTFKKYHLDNKVPMYVRILTPRGCLQLEEESWNAFPYCRTVLTNEFLGERLSITIETFVIEDRGDTENAFRLPPEKLQLREVIPIDIAKNQGPDEEAVIGAPPVDSYVSRKVPGRGPLRGDWIRNMSPVVTCYKLVTVDVRIFGLSGRLESFIFNNERRLFTAFHRRMFALIDTWYGMSIEDIRRLEQIVKDLLDQQRRSGDLRGTRVSTPSSGGS